MPIAARGAEVCASAALSHLASCRAARRRAPEAPAGDDDLSLERVEREHILQVLTLCNGNRGRAASRLGIGVSTLRRKLLSWNE